MPTPTVASNARRIPLLHLALFGVTAITTTMAGAFWEGLDPLENVRLLRAGLPFSVTLIAILLAHESGHYLMCRRHGVLASLPYFLPAPPTFVPLGTFGAFIRIKSRFPDRRALFDIGAAGPWAGFVVAIVALIVGLEFSTIQPAPMTASVIELGDSYLTAFLTRVLLDVDPTRVVLHPIAFAGWIGLLVTSLNLLPAGQLDGGHVLYAVFERRMTLVPLVLVAFLLWLGVSGWPGWFVWAVILALMVRLGHPPTLYDPRPLGTARTVGAFLSLVLFVATFVPEPFRIVP